MTNKRLSKQTMQKYLQQLQTGAPLSSGELRAINVALNNRASDLQLEQLLNSALNCRCSTDAGLLVGFEPINALYGQVYKPIFKQE